MPFVVPLIVILQIGCLIHAIQTDRPRGWRYIILMFPGIGCAAYFAMEILPELQKSKRSQVILKKTLRTLDPEHFLRKQAANLEVLDNVDNRLRMASECLETKYYVEAIKLYRSVLQQPLYENDPAIMLSLATAYFKNEDYADCRAVLETLIEKNPDFSSQSGHLLYARALEALSETDKALEEYAVLAPYYSGYEARCRYGLLLKKLGHTEKAREVFEKILIHADRSNNHSRKLQKEWIQITRQNLG